VVPVSIPVGWLAGVAASLADLVLPRVCVGCGAASGPLCVGCVAGLEPVRGSVGELSVTAAAVYEGAIRTSLLAYKERGRRDLAGVLATVLAQAVGTRPSTGAVLVPVPSTPAARRARGGDHMVRLARATARTCGLRVSTALCHVRAVRDSAGLGSAARVDNLRAAMAATARRDGGGLPWRLASHGSSVGTT